MKINTVEQALAEAMNIKMDANIATLADEGIPYLSLDDLVARNTEGMAEEAPSPKDLRFVAANKALRNE